MQKISCDRCGTCCRMGGPALHEEDLDLILSGLLRLEDLITVRQGEYVHLPLSDDPKPAVHEFVKIRGRGAEWSCIFLDEKLSLCTFYEHRPLACRLLKCWAPDEVLAITGKNLLDRFALVPENEPIAALMHEHERACSMLEVHSFIARLNVPALKKEAAAGLSGLVNADCRFRDLAVRAYQLSLESELFYFGRPLFQLLIPFGLRFAETSGGITIQYDNI